MFYDRFIQLCEQKGVKPTRAALDTGIARSVVSNWKSNWQRGIESLPSTNNAQALAEYFNVPVDYLLGNEEKPAAEDDNELNEMLEDIRRNPELRAMFSITRKATPEQVRQYTDVIKAIKGEK